MNAESLAQQSDGSEAPHQESHIVQFYEDDSFLAETVGTFIGEGIGNGDPIVVIATPDHLAAFCDRLRENSIDVERARKNGQLVLYDAKETLSKLMNGGQPDGHRFRMVIGTVLDEMRSKRPNRRIRAYGEMVDLLWRDGNEEGAIRLEELWNDLGRGYRFTLLCAYLMDNFYRESDAGRFARICDAHTHAYPTERHRRIDDETARMRDISILQQRALSLHNEVERRKKLERELRRQQQELDDFLENAVVAMHRVAADGTILWANRAELSLLGYSPEEYVGHHIAEFHADRAVIDDILARLSRQETLRDHRSQLRCKDGSLRDVVIDSNVRVVDGRMVHTRCFTRDVTASRERDALLDEIAARSRVEHDLRKSETRLRLLIDSIKDYAIFMLDERGQVATWNPGAERIKGYVADEIIGRHFSTFYPPEDVMGGKCEFELQEASRTGRFEDEGWRVRKDGSRFWANVVISAVRDRDGRLLGFSKVTRDLTERRRAEDERAALMAAQKANRAKDEFLAMLGHELRNPLAPIVTALQLMKLRGDVRSSKEQIVIERQVKHVARLVDDLLDVSRITQGKIELKKESFELAVAVAQAVETTSPLLELRRHGLTVDVPRDGMAVHADAVRLAQVITNLITNAAKYTDVEGNIAISAWRDGHEVVLQVKDNGIGIRKDLLPRIFDLFVQGPRSNERPGGGLGIGLTLVKNLVQLHGGTVVALSDGPGQGSAFVVRLPATTLERDNDPVAAASLVAKTTSPKRVLVVDDNTDAAALLGELFSTMGHDVRIAHDGPQALSVLGAGFKPEVAVLDIGLPVMDGYELATRVRDQLGASCRLVALTGYGQEADHRRSLQAGFDLHLVKPVDPMRVLDAVDGKQ